jgi:hypothetical protein
MSSRQRGKFLLGADARDGHHQPAGSAKRVAADPAGNRAERRAAAMNTKTATKEA